MSRIGHTSRRHPLCPSCGYDLVAALDAGRRVCPECGEPFTPGELSRARAPGDWTLLAGLGRLALVLLRRTAVWAAAFLLVAWGAHLLGTLAAARTAGPIVLGCAVLGGLAVMIAGGALGTLVGRGAEELAGFSGGLLVAIVVAWTVGAVILAFAVVRALGLMPPPTAAMAGVAIATLASVLAVRQVLADAY